MEVSACGPPRSSKPAHARRVEAVGHSCRAFESGCEARKCATLAVRLVVVTASVSSGVGRDPPRKSNRKCASSEFFRFVDLQTASRDCL